VMLQLAPSTRRHTDSQSVSVCEAVSGDRCPCKNRARARARTCFTALFYSSRTECTRTCDVIGFHFMRQPSCGNGAFFSRTDFPSLLTHTLSIHMMIHTRVSGVLTVRVKSEKNELYLFLTLFLSLNGSTRLRLPMFSRRGFEGKEIFSIPFANF